MSYLSPNEDVPDPVSGKKVLGEAYDPTKPEDLRDYSHGVWCYINIHPK